MDAFKILTRSTNLARPSTKSHALQVKPSAGEASNPQLFGDAPALVNKSSPLDGIQIPMSKKRKRVDGDSVQGSIIPKTLDFFSNNFTIKEYTRSETAPSTVVARQASQPQTASVEGNSSASAGDENISEEECKRILRSHKIKITQILDCSKHDGMSQDGRKKKKLKKQALEPHLDDPTSTKNRKIEIIPQPLVSFAQLRSRYDIPWKLAANIEAQGYSIPTEVQLGSLPLLLDLHAGGKRRVEPESKSNNVLQEFNATERGINLLTVAPTGSGKTLAFLIPVLNAILKERKKNYAPNHSLRTSEEELGPQAVIIAPTKELANQITNEGRKLTKETGVKIALVRKGMRLPHNPDLVQKQISQLDEFEGARNNDHSSGEETNQTTVPAVTADVLVSTPLTLLHAIRPAEGTSSSLLSVRHLVLDEADVLLDPLFRDQTLQIWSACTNKLLRVNLWSATMGSSIEDLAKSTIETRWKEVSELCSGEVKRPQLLRLVVGLKDSAIPNINHKLIYAANEQGKLMALRQLLRPTAASIKDGLSLQPPFLVFVQTIPRAVALHSELLYDVPHEAGGASRIAVLHADLTDSARELVMTRFRKGEIWILITTDLLSRGVDFRGVNGVVNYDFPNSSAAYVHRVGRTGRAGREGGVAITLYAKEDIPFVKNVANVIAASERQRGGKGDGQGIQQWLLDAMPKPSKKQKQTLKQRGIESRRTGYVPSGKGESRTRSRISTKSGFERKLEHNRKGAAHGAKSKVVGNRPHVLANNDVFSGFED